MSEDYVHESREVAAHRKHEAIMGKAWPLTKFPNPMWVWIDGEYQDDIKPQTGLLIAEEIMEEEDDIRRWIVLAMWDRRRIDVPAGSLAELPDLARITHGEDVPDIEKRGVRPFF